MNNYSGDEMSILNIFSGVTTVDPRYRVRPLEGIKECRIIYKKQLIFVNKALPKYN